MDTDSIRHNCIQICQILWQLLVLHRHLRRSRAGLAVGVGDNQGNHVAVTDKSSRPAEPYGMVS